MKLLQKIRLRKYNSKLSDIKLDLQELSALNKEINIQIDTCKSSNKINASHKNNLNLLNYYITLYENKIEKFKNKYKRWCNNCLKLNSEFMWEDKYDDIYSSNLQKHLKVLKNFKAIFEDLIGFNYYYLR